MKKTNFFIITLIIFLFQIFFTDSLTISNVRPDFLIIYILYTSLIFGRLLSVTLAFFLGILVDLFSASSYFGLAPLALSISAYFFGYLQGKYGRLLPYIFHLFWISTFFLHFFIINYFLFQSLYISEKLNFFIIWFASSFYTLIFIFILQFFYPLKEASDAKVS